MSSDAARFNPVFGFEFPDVWPRPASVPVKCEKFKKFVSDHKLNNGDEFDLSDGDVIVTATLTKQESTFVATLHWATIRDCVV